MLSQTSSKGILKLLNKDFPKTNKFYKKVNRNSVKVSYLCTENISSLNKNKLHPNKVQEVPYNCRQKQNVDARGMQHEKRLLKVHSINTKKHPSKSIWAFQEMNGKSVNIMLMLIKNVNNSEIMSRSLNQRRYLMSNLFNI